MSQSDKMSARDIVDKYSKLYSDPVCFAGRGNTTGDLDSNILEQVYGGIKTEIGNQAAKAFVNMVAGMGDDASASGFLLSLYQLERQDWVHIPQSRRTVVDNILEIASNASRDNDKRAMETVKLGFLSIAAGMDRSNTPASWITGAFLMNHSSDINNPEKASALKDPYGYLGHRRPY